MKVDRAIRGLCLSLLVVVPFAHDAEAKKAADCDTKCEIQNELKIIYQQIRLINEQLQNLTDSDEPATSIFASATPAITPISVSEEPLPETVVTTLPTISPVNPSAISSWYSVQPQTTLQTVNAPPSSPSVGFTETPLFSQPVSPSPEPFETASAQGFPSGAANTPTAPYSVPYATPTTFPGGVMGGGDGYRTVGYFTNWGIYARNYTPDKVPLDQLTHILYAFADNSDNGSLILTDSWSDTDKHYAGDSWNDQGNNMYGNLKQLNLLKKRNRNLKIMLSIGGWTYTNEQKHFDTPASTDAGRKAFAASCVQFIKDYAFDGIDLDWEYPSSTAQGEQLHLLLQEIRTAMDAYSAQVATELNSPTAPHFELSIAAPGGKQNYDNLPLQEIAQTLDFINIMAYDFTGSWSSVTGHQANLYPSTSCPACTPLSIQSIITDYLAAGVPSNQLVLGMPLYGRAFTNTDGIGKPYQGIGTADQEHGSWEAGVWDYKVLPRPGATEFVDQEAGASYSYDSGNRTLITYDNVEIAKRKAQYIQQQNLGGAMWWELSGDRTDDQGSLITNVVTIIGGPDYSRLQQKSNWLAYPDSKYDNVRAGFPAST